MNVSAFPPALDYLRLVPWALFLVAVFFLREFVASVRRLAREVGEHGERLATIEGALAERGLLERRHAGPGGS